MAQRAQQTHGAQRIWFITGVSSGFGRELTEQLLEGGQRVVGTVRDTGKFTDLLEQHSETFRVEVLASLLALSCINLILQSPCHE